MQEKFLDKLVKKNYNNELEKVLENKTFDENTKNLLLGILYKIEAAYNDYKTVKRDVDNKDEYINKIISIIKNDCEHIVLIKQNENSTLGKRTFIVNKNQKEIIAYPIERKVLYAISKISKKDIILKDKYEFLDELISESINVGNNINTVEVLRDFNGWSWSTVNKEIESIEYNLIYQNVLILIGNKNLEYIVKNDKKNVNYLEFLQEKLKNKMR